MSTKVGLFIDSLTSYHKQCFLRHKKMQHYSSLNPFSLRFSINKTAKDLKLRKCI